MGYFEAHRALLDNSIDSFRRRICAASVRRQQKLASTLLGNPKGEKT
jgi:hypothetical protein